MQKYSVVLDTCVLVQLARDQNEKLRIKKMIKGKNITFIIPSIIQSELYRVAGITKNDITRMLGIFNKKIFFDTTNPDRNTASQVNSQFFDCHNGDDLILALCKDNDYLLVTFDKKFLRVSQLYGIAAFHPKYMESI